MNIAGIKDYKNQATKLEQKKRNAIQKKEEELKKQIRKMYKRIQKLIDMAKACIEGELPINAFCYSSHDIYTSVKLKISFCDTRSTDLGKVALFQPRYSADIEYTSLYIKPDEDIIKSTYCYSNDAFINAMRRFIANFDDFESDFFHYVEEEVSKIKLEFKEFPWNKNLFTIFLDSPKYESIDIPITSSNIKKFLREFRKEGWMEGYTIDGYMDPHGNVVRTHVKEEVKNALEDYYWSL